MTKLNMDKLLQKGLEQVKSAGITPGNINPKVIINSRAKNRFGVCRRTMGKYDFEIEMNSKLLEAKEEKAMNTMVHEILHSCKDCMNHGKTWKAYANIMNTKFGYDIARTTSHEKLGIETPVAKYTIECQKCHSKINRQKKSNLVTHTHHYKCGKCGGKLILK